MSLKRGAMMRAGDLLCPDVDLDDWETNCRAPLFNNQWNQWLIIRSSSDNPSQIADRAAWFMNAVNQRLEGKIRHVTVRVSDVGVFAATTPVQTTIRHCAQGQFASLKPSKNFPPFYSAFVRFVYRGNETDMPWPSILHANEVQGKASVIVGNYNCPVKAAWLLDTVFQPSSENVPDASTDSILSPGYQNEAKGLGLPSLPTVKLVLGGVGIVAAAVVAAYVIRSIR